MADTRIEFRCEEEGLLVGTITLPEGQRVKLTAQEAIRRFVPESQAFRLSGDLRDGDYLRCPRCKMPLRVTGKLGKESGPVAVVLGALTIRG